MMPANTPGEINKGKFPKDILKGIPVRIPELISEGISKGNLKKKQ